ncbi:ABC transporter ATP-binding protein [Ancylobacter dichloromethanicus]|uniref:Multidrug ABC transporter ATP-binding protein n=1 Tax=Ancylobacter dichloromethanicus TaxID=518825 RepID=A0A9W6MZH4_9HYPH|nr:ABC transporter ATP-binding protein [Ancylobacter dichloromethanicus]MBS7552752.1 ABC transporter ATP-binding protein [Ancylobacter dichloromethanicus]GLK72116.1 multidrug ABC transporter ATP-binding protein [Ancylobacter dichloromethanicus]
MKLIRPFLTYYAPYKGLFMLDFSCAVLSGLLELGFPVAVKLFIDHLLPGQDWHLIVWAAIGLLVIYLLNAGLMAIVTYWGHMLGINIETEMRKRAFDHVQKLSFSFFDNHKTGHLVARLTKDLEEIGEVAHHGPEDVFIAVMTFIGAFAVMLSVNIHLAILTAVIVPASALITTRYGRRMTQNFRALFGRVGAFNARIEENIGGIRVVQSFANEEHESRLFAVENDSYRTTKLEAYRLLAANASLSYLGMRLTQVVIMLAGTWFVLRGELSNGGFVGFLLLVGVFFRPLEKIAAVMEVYPKGIAGLRSYLDFLATRPDVADRPGAVELTDVKGAIRYEGVRFAYGNAPPVLGGIDLDIRAGESVAFVGPSGSGKTTLCSLLPRFYEVGGGRITIDGHDIRDVTLESLRRNIGIVQQDVFLFSGTIRENIAYGRLDADEAAINEAAHRAQLDEVIAGLPLGLDTVIGERGVKLSGGQKQRLAIARMFLKDPPILILDEATSALDSETEWEIQRALAALSEGRTTLVIAHRLSTVRSTDRIVVVTREGVAEQGNHAELLDTGGLYARMVRTQFAEAHRIPA